MERNETSTDRAQLAIAADPDKAAPAAASLAQFDQQSASRMLRILIVFAWALAGATLASALLGLGSPLSNALA